MEENNKVVNITENIEELTKGKSDKELREELKEYEDTLGY